MIAANIFKIDEVLLEILIDEPETLLVTVNNALLILSNPNISTNKTKTPRIIFRI